MQQSLQQSMQQSMQQWFNNLKRQEQLMLLIGGTIIIAYLLLTALWRPMAASVDTLARQNQAARETLQNVQSLAVEYKTLQRSGAGNSRNSKQNLTRLIDSTVKKNQLIMNRFQPSSSGDVQVRLENAVFNNVLAWINELESDNGVIVKDLSISPGNASGVVNVSIRLRQDG
ncbi:MAG: type II secretion system protein M [Pseudomonadales bacterium]